MKKVKQKQSAAFNREIYYLENIIRIKPFAKAIKRIQNKYLPDGKPSQNIVFKKGDKRSADLEVAIRDLLQLYKINSRGWFDFFFKRIALNSKQTPTEYLKAKIGYENIKLEKIIKGNPKETLEFANILLRNANVGISLEKHIKLSEKANEMSEDDYYSKLLERQPLFEKYRDKIDMNDFKKIANSYSQDCEKDCLVTVDDLHSTNLESRNTLKMREEFYPVAIRINPNANKENIKDFIKTNWPLIEAFNRVYKHLYRHQYDEFDPVYEDLICNRKDIQKRSFAEIAEEATAYRKINGFEDYQVNEDQVKSHYHRTKDKRKALK